MKVIIYIETQIRKSLYPFSNFSWNCGLYSSNFSWFTLPVLGTRARLILRKREIMHILTVFLDLLQPQIMLQKNSTRLPRSEDKAKAFKIYWKWLLR